MLVVTELVVSGTQCNCPLTTYLKYIKWLKHIGELGYGLGLLSYAEIGVGIRVRVCAKGTVSVQYNVAIGLESESESGFGSVNKP